MPSPTTASFELLSFCMSLERRVSELELEVAELRALVEVQGRALRRLVAESRSESDFELVSELSRPFTPAKRDPPPPEREPAPAASSSPRPADPTQGHTLSHAEREEIARGVGRLMRRALEGGYLGSSGRGGLCPRLLCLKSFPRSVPGASEAATVVAVFSSGSRAGGKRGSP